MDEQKYLQQPIVSLTIAKRHARVRFVASERLQGRERWTMRRVAWLVRPHRSRSGGYRMGPHRPMHWSGCPGTVRDVPVPGGECQSHAPWCANGRAHHGDNTII